MNNVNDIPEKGMLWDAKHDRPYSLNGEIIDYGETPIDEMTVTELKAYADKHNIDISKVTLKPDIIAVIKAAGD